MERELDLPDAWSRAADGVQTEGGIALILGDTSSGKTTLLKYLAERLSHREQPVAVVDADIGQSTIGPPTTICGVVFKSLLHPIETMAPQEMFFVGSTSPAGHLVQDLVGVKKMVDWTMSTGAQSVLVDTTGMVRGHEASLLKFHKIELLQPRSLLVLQQHGELESLISPFIHRKSIQIHRLPISPMARTRSQEERRSYRVKKFRDYFRKASVKLISTRELIFLNQTSENLPRYLLVGLNDAEHRTLGVGIVEAFDRRSQEIFVYTPVQDLTPLKSITLGSLRVDSSGRELEER
jgi:polynucleotide 5'-hydroxyl-kinase GRC3/NOL9